MATRAREALPVISPHGDLDADTIGPLAARLEAAATGGTGVILDAGGITFGDSTFLNLLLRTHRRTDLRVAAPHGSISRLLSLTGADAFLHIYPSVEDAQAGPRRPDVGPVD